MSIRASNQWNAYAFTQFVKILIVKLLFLNVMMLNFQKTSVLILCKESNKFVLYSICAVMENSAETGSRNQNVIRGSDELIDRNSRSVIEVVVATIKGFA